MGLVRGGHLREMEFKSYLSEINGVREMGVIFVNVI